MKILKTLSEAMGVSGAEGEVRSKILDLIKPHVDEIKTDTMGNVLAIKRGTGKVKMTVMVDAHMDEVGLMVIGHTSEGMLRVAAIGGLDDRILLGKRVLVGPRRLPGLIGAKPVHLMDTEEREKVIKLEAMRVDIGAANKSAAEGKAPLGTRIGFDSIFQPIGKLVSGKALDNRVGCSVLVHLLQAERFPCDVVGVFAVQEEVGLRGARVAAQAIGPDCAIVLEGTIADDLPKDKDQSPITLLGKGPALSLMDRSTLFDPRLTGHFTQTAEAHKIPVQFKQPGVGGTDAGSIHLTGSGVPSVAISTPCRYIHSPAAMLDRRDYQNGIALVDAALRSLNRDVLRR